MSAKKKSPRRPSLLNRQLLQLVDEYAAETGATEIDPMAVAAWAKSRNRADAQPQDTLRLLARSFSRAMRQDYIEDEDGEPVRHRHAYKVSEGEKQEVFWFKMEEATPQKMRLSAQWRRRGIAADCFQLDRDLKFYNKNYNPGEPIDVSYNFDPDVVERKESDEYDDTPPEDAFED